MASTWPETCPVCEGPWKIRSRTMGAAHGQPHEGRCVNGHWWHETASPSPRPQSLPTGIAIISQQPQRQDSLTEQLSDLHAVATRLGMYDAADFITQQLSQPKRTG